MEDSNFNDNNSNLSSSYIIPQLPEAPSGGQAPQCWSNVKVEAQPEFRSIRDSLANNGGENGKQQLREALRAGKRRMIQQILVKLNQAVPSDDSEYTVLRARHLELHEHVVAVMTHIKNFAMNIIALGHGATLIGEKSAQIANSGILSSFSNQEISSASGVTFEADFPRNMATVDSNARELAALLLTTVVGALEKKMALLLAIKKEMDEREKLKLDFDSAVRKLRLAKEKNKPETIVRRDVKLQAARNALVLATEAIVTKFLYYENARSTLIYHELRQFRELQNKFFSVCSTLFQMPE